MAVTERDRHDHESSDLFIFVAMSHGTEGCFLGSDGEDVNIYDDIIKQFRSDMCEGLMDKPKVFIFQQCRGTGIFIFHSHDLQTPN